MFTIKLIIEGGDPVVISATAGEKLLDNAGLVFEPSTDTEEGQDDYLNGQHSLFEWVRCNYIRDDDGTGPPGQCGH